MKIKQKTKMKERGITLIALVITIIILLILAAVTISALSGDNGILQKAAEARTQTIKANEIEEIRLAYNAIKIEKETKTSKAIASKELKAEMIEIGENNTSDLITAEELKNEMIRNGRSEDEIDVTGEGTLTIHFLDTDHIYSLEQNGEIEEQEKEDITLELYANVEGNNVTIGARVDGIEEMTYEEFAESRLEGKTPEQKEQMILDGCNYAQELLNNASFNDISEILEYLGANSIEELTNNNIDQFLKERRAC